MPAYVNESGRQLGAPSGSRLESQLLKERWTPVDVPAKEKSAAPAPAPVEEKVPESAPRRPGRPKKEVTTDA
jgi:hypothetical protein